MIDRKLTNDEALEAAKDLFISGGLMAEEAEFKYLDNDHPRFADSIDVDKKNKKHSGYIVIYQNDDGDYVRITGKSHHTALPILTWDADGLSSIIDDTERTAYLAKLEENRNRLLDQREQQYSENRQLLADALTQFSSALPDHPYLQKKTL